MIPKKSNLEAPRKPRVVRWPEDAGWAKNLKMGDVLVVDGERYGVTRGGRENVCAKCALNKASLKGRERCVALEERYGCCVLPCMMCNGGSLVNNDFYFERL